MQGPQELDISLRSEKNQGEDTSDLKGKPFPRVRAHWQFRGLRLSMHKTLSDSTRSQKAYASTECAMVMTALLPGRGPCVSSEILADYLSMSSFLTVHHT